MIKGNFRNVSVSKVLISLAVVSFLLLGIVINSFPTHAVISGTLASNETVANLSAVNDQSAVTVSTPSVTAGASTDESAVTANPTPNISEVKAKLEVTVHSLPTHGDTVTIGDCVVTFEDWNGTGDNTSAPANDLDCSDDAAMINNYTAADPGVALSNSDIAAALGSLSSIDSNLGSLTPSVSTNVASFEASQTSDSTINYADGSASTSVVSTAGVLPVAQVNTITITGTVEEGDVYSITSGTTVEYTVSNTDSSSDDIAAGLNAAIQADGGYAAAPYTSSVLGNVITLEAKDEGIAFVQSSNATNRAAAAQVNTITITGTVEEGDVYAIQVNGTIDIDYTVSNTDSSSDDIAAGLNAAIQAHASYATADYISSVMGNVVTLTGANLSSSFTQTSSITNRTAIPQVVEFTPMSVVEGEKFELTINGTDYNYVTESGDDAQDVVEALAPQADGNAAVDCTEDDTKVVCTAAVAGTAFTYDSSVADTTPPTLSPVSISSDNADSSLAKVGDIVTLTFTASELIDLPTVTIATHSVVPVNTSGNSYEATYVMVSGDSSGAVPFTIDFVDDNGVVGTQVAATTDASVVTFDKTAPTAGIVYSPNHAVKQGDSLIITANFSEPLQDSPVVQLEISGANTLAATAMTKVSSAQYTYTHTVGAGDGSATVVLSVGLDLAGNLITAAPTSGADFTVDNSAPIISTLSLSPSTGTAKIGDVVTLNISADGNDYTAGAITVNGVVATGFVNNGGGSYSVSYTVVSGNLDRAAGMVPASVVLSDPAGNESLAYTSVDANTLAVDANAPVLSDVTLSSSNNADNALAKEGDTVTLTFTSNEEIGSPVVSFTSGGDPVNGAINTGNVGNDWTVTYDVAAGDTEGSVAYNIAFADVSGNAGVAVTSGLGSVEVDMTAPSLNEETAVPASTNDTTPDYTFSSDEAGLISYNGACSSAVTDAIVGDNTITFAPLSNGTYSNCEVIVTDYTGNASAPLSVSTFVVDTEIPVITLVGGDQLNIYTGSVYTDAGATADDNQDGDITGSIVVNNPVDTSIVGDYQVTYDVTDSTGNDAAQVTRTVHVWALASNQQLAGSSVTLTDTENAVAVGDNAPASIINVPSSVTSPQIDLTALLETSGANQIVTLPSSITISSAVGLSGNVTITLPAGLIITGDAGWNGTLYAPINQLPNYSLASFSVSSAVEIGLISPGSLTFDQAVRILFVDRAGEKALFSNGPTDTEIVIICTADNQADVDTQFGLANEACKIDVASDLAIWTRHLTLFATYNTAPLVVGGGSGGGGGGGGSSSGQTPPPAAVPIVVNPPVNLPVPQVLGETLNPHPEGTFIIDGKTIYLINNGQRRGFVTYEEFLTYGKVTVVAANGDDLKLPLGALMRAKAGTVVTDPKDRKTIFLINDQGEKQGFVTYAAFRRLKYTLGQVKRFNLSEYPVGPVIK